MLDIKKLRAQKEEIRKRAKEEELANFRDYYQNNIFELLGSDFLSNELKDIKAKPNVSQSSRVLHNWQKEGVLSDEVAAGKWRQFNKVNSIWINIVALLREYGLGLNVIKEARKHMFTSEMKGFLPLEYAIIHSILKEPMVILIHLNGQASMLPKTLFAQKIVSSELNSFICVDLMQFIKKEYPNNTFNETALSIDAYNLTEKELKLLYYLRTGNYESIKVSMKDGDMYLLEAYKRINPKSKIVDIIKKHSYQSIEIKTENSKIVNIQSNEKIKL